MPGPADPAEDADDRGAAALSSWGAVDMAAPASPSAAASSPGRVPPVSFPSGSAAGALLLLSVVLIRAYSFAQIPTVKPLVHTCISLTMVFHTPVTSSRPVRISMPPPMRITHA